MFLSSLRTVEWDVSYEKAVGQPRSLKVWSLPTHSFPRPVCGPLCVRVWEHHRVPGAEGLRAHCHPVSQVLGFCFVLDLWLGTSHRVQVHNSGRGEAVKYVIPVLMKEWKRESLMS